MERARRDNKGKPRWSLVDFESLEPMVSVLEYGAGKYGRDNWKKGLPIEEVCESMLRHIFKLLQGEETDQESGLPHIGHIQANAMFMGFEMNKKIEDLTEILNKYPAPEGMEKAWTKDDKPCGKDTVETSNGKIVEAQKDGTYIVKKPLTFDK